MRKIIVISLISLLLSSNAIAQFGFGGGLGYGVPFVLNKQGYYIRHSLGAGFDVSYKPMRSRIYPSLSFCISQMQLLVTAPNYNDLNDATNYKNATLNLNYKAGDGPQYFVFYAGAGIGSVKPERTSLQEISQSVNLQLVDSGASKFCPLFNIGMKCYVRITEDAPLYLGVDAKVQYLQIVQSDPEYYLHDGNKTVKADISGNYLLPAIFLSLNYFFEKSVTQPAE